LIKICQKIVKSLSKVLSEFGYIGKASGEGELEEEAEEAED
jgi:hypothetical protein